MAAMDPAATAPYATLTPDRVLDALESVGLRGDGRMLALNSYENRVYQIYMEEGTAAPAVVAKFYRPGRWSDAAILEEHAFTLELAEREIPVVAPLVLGGRTLHAFEGFRFAVYPRRGGRVPEFGDPRTLEWMGRFIARIHAVGALSPFVHRPVLDIASFGEEPREYLLRKQWIPSELTEAYASAVDLALAGVRRAYERAGSVAVIRLHGDCHAGNVLWTELREEAGSAERTGGPHFVDFDDCRSGPAVQDLWMLLSGDRAEMTAQLAHVLAGYERFCAFDPRELHLVEALRTLRLIHYSAWLARRWEDPAFPAAFPWFNTQRYWQERILELREQIGALDEPPLQSG
ncbi:MAG: serine/threonine protein kinase [Burkholderiales bacterium]|nr:serine/threonine protein kinase [Burkholderiales bacterium]